MTPILLALSVALASLAWPADAAPNCKRGKPCGQSCIAVDNVCRK